MEGPRNHVLVVDTNQDFLITVERLLEEQGLDTTTIWSVREALALLDSRHFEAVLIGHHPPELDASEILLYSAKAGTPSAFFVLQPIRRESAENGIFLSQGAREVLCKWPCDDLVERVRKCLVQPVGKGAMAA